MTCFSFSAKNPYFPDFEWPNQISDSTIEFYGENYIYAPKKLVWVQGGMILGVTLVIFRDRGSDWLISGQDWPTYDFPL